MAMNLLKLSQITGDLSYSDSFENQIDAFSGEISQNPLGYVYMLTSFLGYIQPDQRVFLVSDESESRLMPFINVINENYRPFTVLILYGSRYKRLEDVIPHIKDYTAPAGKTAAYVCENFTCNEPVSDLDEFARLMS